MKLCTSTLIFRMKSWHKIPHFRFRIWTDGVGVNNAVEILRKSRERLRDVRNISAWDR